MKVIRQQDYETMLWKNGLGSTREICCEHIGNELAWRLSLAKVTADGPFSKFAGLERILTVISGHGLRLISDDEELDASPFHPVRFSGDTPIMGYCQDGPVEDFNLIFDPAHFDADVRIIDASKQVKFNNETKAITAIHALDGQISIGQDILLKAGDTCVFKNEAASLSARGNQRCIAVTLRHR